MLSEKDVSIITQVAFKGAVDAQTVPLSTTEGQGEFALNFTYLKDILFSEVGGTPAPPAAVAAVQPTYQAAPLPPVENVIHAAFPGTTQTLHVKGTQHGELPHWLLDQASAVGVTEVWDNRDRLPEGHAKGKNWPWFRSAHDHIDKAFWPPKAA